MPGQMEQRVRTLLFLHILKTAGTALRSAIERNFRMSEMAHLYPDPMLFPARTSLWSLPLGQRSRLRLVVGHFYFGIHMALPGPVDYVTVLRNPVNRAISQYFHFVRNAPELVSDGDERLSLEEVFERRDNVALDNLMVRMLAGVDEHQLGPGGIDRSVFDVALHNLRTQFAHVGFQETAAETLRFVEELLASRNSPDLKQENVGHWHMSESELASARAAVEHFDKWDTLLYQRALEMFPGRSAGRVVHLDQSSSR